MVVPIAALFVVLVLALVRPRARTRPVSAVEAEARAAENCRPYVHIEVWHEPKQ